MKPFRYYVHDENGYVGMEIFNSKERPETHVRVHYPMIEGFPVLSPLLADRSTFKEMRIADFGYMLFAYNRSEFVKFDTFLKNWLRENFGIDYKT